MIRTEIMNILLSILSLLVMYEGVHFGVKKTGERIVPEKWKKFLVFNADVVEIFELFVFKFITWLAQFVCLISLIQLSTVDFTGEGYFQITNYNQAAKWFLASVTLDFLKGVFSNVSKKERSESKISTSSLNAEN